MSDNESEHDIETDLESEPEIGKEPIPVRCVFEEMVAIADLKPHPQNPNTHPERQVKILAKLLAYHGWRKAIVVSATSGYITRGHGAVEAAKYAGETHVPVDRQEYDSPTDELADVIADNQVAKLSKIDETRLKLNLDSLSDVDVALDVAGFDQEAITDLEIQLDKLNDERKGSSGSGDQGSGSKDPKIITCPECGHQWGG